MQTLARVVTLVGVKRVWNVLRFCRWPRADANAILSFDEMTKMNMLRTTPLTFFFAGCLAMIPVARLAAADQVSAAGDKTVDASTRGNQRGTDDRPVVETRKSSAAALAKGDINFDDLKFEIEKDQPFKREMLTKEVEKLNGRKVKIRGYILPSTLFKETDIDQFVLVRDTQECCFGPGAALFDCIIIEMVPGKTTDFVTRPVTVEGKFKIDTEKYKYPPGGGPQGASHFAVFKIDGIAVK